MKLEIKLVGDQSVGIEPLLESLRKLGYKHLLISTNMEIVTAVKGSAKGLRTLLYSYNQAQGIVKDLNIRAKEVYTKRHKEDPRLPPHPELTYAKEWTNWQNFFGKRFYSYAEASAKAQELGIKSQKEYSKRYKEDSKLPSAPNIQYQNKWKGLGAFLGTK